MAVSRYEVLRAFVVSKERGTAVGIRLKGRPSLLITTISEVTGRLDDDTRIMINDQSIYGEPIASRSLKLSDIDGIFNLRICFDDPFYIYLRNVRDNIRSIRDSAVAAKVTVSR